MKKAESRAEVNRGLRSTQDDYGRSQAAGYAFRLSKSLDPDVLDRLMSEASDRKGGARGGRRE